MHRKPERGPRTFGKAFLVVTALALGSGLWFGLVFFRTVETAGQKAQDALISALAKAFRPNVDVRTTVLSSLGKLKKHSKWVVLTTHLDVSITKESHKTMLWDMLDLGTTTVTVQVPDNRVQYVVDLRRVGPESFSVEGRFLMLTLPSPRVDEDIVEVQSDPSKINVRTEVGWARLKSRSGERLRQQALTEIRAVVLEHARAEPLLLQARARAEGEVKKLLEALTPHLREGVELGVRFEGAGGGRP